MSLTSRPPARHALAVAYNLGIAAIIGTFVGGVVLAFAVMELKGKQGLLALVGGFAGTLSCTFWIMFTSGAAETSALVNGMPATARRFAFFRAFGSFATLVCLSATVIWLFRGFQGSGGLRALSTRTTFVALIELALFGLILLCFALAARSAALRLPLLDLVSSRVPDSPRGRLHWVCGAKPERLLKDEGAPPLRPEEKIVMGAPGLYRTSERLIMRDEDDPGRYREIPIASLKALEEEREGENRWLVARLPGGDPLRLVKIRSWAKDGIIDLFRFALLDELPPRMSAHALKVQERLGARLEPGETVRAVARGSKRAYLMSQECRDDAGFVVTDRRVMRFGPLESSSGLRLDTGADIAIRLLGPDMSPWMRWEITHWNESRVIDRLIFVAHSDESQFAVPVIADTVKGPVSFLPPALRLW